MSAIVFYFLYSILWTLSLLPLSILYLFSNGLYFLLYYVLQYRKSVVKENLKNAFPGKSDEERLRIEKAFYIHFTDLIIEILKMIHLTKKQIAKRIPLINPEILDKYRNEGRSVVAVGGHYCNWEWTVGIVQHLNYKTIGVYKPLNNKYFDKLVSKSRSKFGSEMVSMKEVIRVLVKLKKEKTPTFNVFVADQSPVWQEIQYWLPFLNQNTAVYLGPEKIAKQFNMVVLFGKVRKTGRGKYTVEFIPVEENPMGTPEHIIMKKFMGMLEEQINETPEYWLWSHRRWKHTRKRENEEKSGIYRFTGKGLRLKVKG